MTTTQAHEVTTLHPLLAQRWSPRAFDPTPLAGTEIASVLEAARWAPSAMNAQPWRFLVGRRHVDGPDATYDAILAGLAPGNQAWAHLAPVLVAAVVRVVEEDGSERGIAGYELGLAVAQLTAQAQAQGLHVHQMGGIDAAALAASFDVPATHRVVTVLAVGQRGDVADLPDWAAEREGAPRERLSLGEIAYSGTWGRPAAL